jgi:alpha-galactosidase
MWSGAWSLGFNRTPLGLVTAFGLAPMKTTVTSVPVDGPHVIFGVVAGGLSQASAALRSYAIDGIRGGRPLAPLVTYNTWFAYGTGVDEAAMRAEMDSVARLGTELFVVDAGWYADAGATGLFDFDSGLGTWKPDLNRFPNGLKPLTDYAHRLGMKVGFWVEPERVDLSTVGRPGPDESWLAMISGSYGSDRAGQICLASDQARQWVFDRLTALIDAAQPDYLKWDNNMWINCERQGHGHGPADGNFAHVKGLYDLLGALRERYPDLLIENASGGGNRLDLGMLQFSDIGWMDDRTAPSVHVRHNIEGLSAVFPPAYLLSFVTSHKNETIHDAPDLALYFRSRMEAALGLCFLSADLSKTDVAKIAHEIDIYKAMRHTLSSSAGALLTAQARAENGPAWDVLQETAAGATHLLIHAFQSDHGVTSFNVKPVGLDQSVMYDVSSVDSGYLGTASGADLMTDGIDVLESPTTAAHTVVITAQP